MTNNIFLSITTTQNPLTHSIHIYPTLVNDFITIDYSPSIAIENLDIYAINGEKIATKKIASNMNLGTLSKGMYIIVIQKSDNNKEEF